MSERDACYASAYSHAAVRRSRQTWERSLYVALCRVGSAIFRRHKGRQEFAPGAYETLFNRHFYAAAVRTVILHRSQVVRRYFCATRVMVSARLNAAGAPSGTMASDSTNSIRPKPPIARRAVAARVAQASCPMRPCSTAIIVTKTMGNEASAPVAAGPATLPSVTIRTTNTATTTARSGRSNHLRAKTGAG